MNYIYDILLNLDKKVYDFYEWNISDEIIHIRKIPIFKISDDDYDNLYHKSVNIDDSFLKMINNRCEIFSSHNVKTVNNLCLLSNNKDVIAVEFNSKGIKTRISKLLIDECEEVLDVAEHINITSLNYIINRDDIFDYFKTRKELRIYDYIVKQLNRNNYDKLKYLYFDYFDKEEDNYFKIIMELKKEINDNWKLSYDRIYNFLRLSSQKQ